MPTYQTPGVYVEELPGGARSIQSVGTSTAGFVGVAPDGGAFVDEARAVNNWGHFARDYVGDITTSTPLSHAVYGFFQNGGRRCYVVNIGPDGSLVGGARRQGLDVLEQVDEVAIVAAPGYADAASYDALLSHCEKMKDRVCILDGPAALDDLSALTRVATAGATGPPPERGRAPGDVAPAGEAGAEGGEATGDEPPEDAPAPRPISGGDSPLPGSRPRQSDGGYGAFYFPWIEVRDPLAPNTIVAVAPSGHLAGVWARTDGTRGVHKAPANETVRGALKLTYVLTGEEQGELNDNGVNCIRFFTREGIRVWGARTVADASGEWRYLNVRRLFNMIEESIVTSTRWIVFEPNDRTLWKSIRRDITAFLTRVWRDGALMGATPEEAFYVQCDEETNPPEVVEAGQVVVRIGIAPVKPAEFIIFRISQHASGTDVDIEG